ncbi:hypothetical protein BDA99DRAFT_530506 [Phascolomyces articulosus]|uniref:DUF1206 domain-containing protein n=1 Tax=Phascolomyces articulosus TaxID=60185 RepID=A0AAD5JK75_9FUNG|nr:hypothetical protein BDA99DRAFT_530506 [Phascolomyces articulosus]
MNDDQSNHRSNHANDSEQTPSTTVIEVDTQTQQYENETQLSFGSVTTTQALAVSSPDHGLESHPTNDHHHRQQQQDNTSIATTDTSESERIQRRVIKAKKLPFYQGGVRPQHVKIVRFIGRCGFIAKGVVYGIIGVLIMTNVSGTYTPNGSQGNESPQGAFLLLGGIPAIGRPILVVMAIGLITYLCWRFWEAITGQAYDAALSDRTNFFRYRLSPIVSGLVYCGYLYYLIQMIYQTEEEQRKTASSKEFPASWTDTTVGSAFVGIFGVAFMIAFITQMVNAVTGNFIPDLKTCEPTARKWEAITVHMFGRIGFGGRAAMFGTLSGFFWESLAERNESGEINVIAAAIGKLSTHTGGLFFMVLLGLGLIIYGLFAIGNAYYKYFPTPPPSRVPLYVIEENDDVSDDEPRQEGLQEQEEDSEINSMTKNTSADRIKPKIIWWRRFWMRVHPTNNKADDIEKQFTSTGEELTTR